MTKWNQRRLLALWLAGVLVALVLPTLAQRPSGIGDASVVPTLASAPSMSPEPTLEPTARPTPKPTPKPTPRATAKPSKSLSGTASWGDFDGHVVTRLPRGTSIVVVGPTGTWRGKSWGYGPAKWTGRIVDLDVLVFEDICGPRSQGLCQVTLYWR